MTFDKDHWESYERPELALHVLSDANDKQFLLLTGPEPDHEWELFTAAARSLADRLGAGPAITYFGVPMGIPHTRPLGVLAHASRTGLVTSRMPVPSKLQVPASAAALLEFRFGEAGRDSIGFAVQVAALPVAGRVPDRRAGPARLGLRGDRARPARPRAA